MRELFVRALYRLCGGKSRVDEAEGQSIVGMFTFVIGSFTAAYQGVLKVYPLYTFVISMYGKIMAVQDCSFRIGVVTEMRLGGSLL